MQCYKHKNPILIVEDQADLLECLAMTLECFGYMVLKAYDGIEALEILRNHAVDLILSDIAMPRMNGYELCQYVRENPDWGHIPFVFLTGWMLESDPTASQANVGATACLMKPIQPEVLLQAIHERLDYCACAMMASAPSFVPSQ